MSDGTKPSLVSSIVQKMWDDESLAETIRSLYAGPRAAPPLPYSDSTSPKITERKPLSHPLKSKVDIDVAYVEGVVSYNTLLLDRTVDHVYPDGDPQPSRNGSALYGLASLCNHSCLPTAYRSFFGDFIVMRASRDIKQGEEITIQYIPDEMHMHRRHLKLLKLCIQCDCMLCKADVADGEDLCTIRKETLEEWCDTMCSEHVLEYSTERILQIQDSYIDSAARRECGVKPDIMHAYSRLARALASHFVGKTSVPIAEWSESITDFMFCLEAQGIKVLDKSTSGTLRLEDRDRLPIDTARGPIHFVYMCTLIPIQIAHAFICIKDKERTERWLKVSEWSKSFPLNVRTLCLSLSSKFIMSMLGEARNSSS